MPSAEALLARNFYPSDVALHLDIGGFIEVVDMVDLPGM